MQTIPIPCTPLVPNLGILAQSAISTARDIGEDTVESQFRIRSGFEVRVKRYVSVTRPTVCRHAGSRPTPLRVKQSSINAEIKGH